MLWFQTPIGLFGSENKLNPENNSHKCISGQSFLLCAACTHKTWKMVDIGIYTGLSSIQKHQITDTICLLQLQQLKCYTVLAESGLGVTHSWPVCARTEQGLWHIMIHDMCVQGQNKDCGTFEYRIGDEIYWRFVCVGYRYTTTDTLQGQLTPKFTAISASH